MVTTNISNDDFGRDIIQQSDGKFIVTGNSLFSNSDIIAVRYNNDGSLDTSFDTDGKVNIGVLSNDDIGYSLIQQTDGKIVISGTAFNGNDTDIAVVRLNTNGSLDTSFDSDGKLTKALGTIVITPTDQVTISVATPAVITWSNNGLAANTPVKFTTTGTLPTGLAANVTYYVKTILNANTFTVSSSPAGSAIATTVTGTGTHTATASVTVGADDHAYSVIQQTDGRLVIAGDASFNSLTDFVVARFLSNGALDTSFDVDGIAITNLGTGNDTAYSLVQQTDGKLVAAGTGFDLSSDFALVRYNTDGSLDTSFSGDGKQTTNINSGLGADSIYAVALQTDGKLLAAGKAVGANSSDDIGLARYNTDGSLDTGFGTLGGKTAIGGGSTESRGYAMTQQLDGKLVIAGYANQLSSALDFAIARYNIDGSLDTSFSGDGLQITPFSSFSDIATTVMQYQKAIINPFRTATISVASPSVVTWTANGLPLNTPVVFTTTGTLPVGLTTDTTYYVKTILTANTFNVSSTPGGVAITATAAGSGIHTAHATGVASPHLGKILTAGYRATTTTNYDILLSRYTTDGTQDASFATSGKYNTPISSSYSDVINDVIELDSGHIMATGYINTAAADGSSDFALMRFQSNGGSRDGTFNGIGSIAVNISQLVYGTTKEDKAQSLIQDNNGKIVVVGSVMNNDAAENREFVIARFLIDGTLDTTFSADGITTTNLSANDDIAYEVKQDAAGKYVVAGSSNENFAVARYNNDGTLDTSFAGGVGYISIPIGSNVDIAYSLDIQPDGKIVVGGYTNINSLDRPAIIRLLADGSLDTTFGVGGKLNIAFQRTATARAMIVQKDGKYTFAGSTRGSTNLLVGRVLVEDADSDGFGDAYDNCPVDANANQANNDGDSQGDVCDDDDDNDGVPDVSDAFPFNPTESVDTDGDGIGDNADNCKFVSNPDQANLDNDAFGDACDGDIDGDGASNTVDSDPYNAAVKTEILLPLNNGYHGSNVKDTQSKQ